ncbi:M20/M25/M40 family metallo-hydrolase [uncultured Martelella sp.]|uniref:M20 family metallopeptidase n=1 Tax=uncultured Martelella sp. TaxID=392331 RepID=UPI0029C89327|nr:M20/M25/M40 family metallo-hydrolase [uncultured Martelella sp.]
MDPKDLINRVDEKACLDFLSMMVQHRSHSETEGEKELAKVMAKELEALGVVSDLQAFDDGKGGTRYNAIGTWKGQGGGKSLLFNGHLDTNPVTEGWTVDPVGGIVDDKFIYGIGVSNMKAGDAAYFCALKTLKDAGIKLKGDVILTFVVGELQGGVGTYNAIKAGYKADYFINSEPTDLYALTMHAEGSGFTIELTGDTRHLSKREEAVDAIMAACDLIPRLNAMTFSGALSPAHESINRVHCGVVHGALGRNLEEWRPPQVADFVVIRGTARYAPGQTFEGAMKDMQVELDALEQRFPGLKAKLIPKDRDNVPNMPAFEVSPESPIVKAINKAYETVRGVPQPTGVDIPSRFYGSDAGHLYHELGMQGIVCGPGGRYNTMPDERVDIVDFIDMIKVYMLAMIEVCEVA